MSLPIHLLSRAHISPLSFFRLSPALRLAVYQHTTPSRSFSISAQRLNAPSAAAAAAATAAVTPAAVPSTANVVDKASSTVLDLVTTVPSGLLDLLHGVGLPWWAVLPISAVLVRGVLVYFTITKPLRRYAQIQGNLVPLVSSRAMWMSATRDMRERVEFWPTSCRRIAGFFYRFRITEQSARQLGKQFGAPRWYQTPRFFANFGVLLLMMETIRMKCGTRQGFLPMLLGPFQSLWDKNAANPVQAKELIDEDDLAEGVPFDVFAAARESTSDPTVLRALAKLDGTLVGPPPVPVYAQHMDPTMQSEGFLWAADLTAIDSYQVLPAFTALIIFTQIALRPNRVNPPASPDVDSGIRLNLSDELAAIRSRIGTSNEALTSAAAACGVSQQHLDQPLSPDFIQRIAILQSWRQRALLSKFERDPVLLEQCILMTPQLQDFLLRYWSTTRAKPFSSYNLTNVSGRTWLAAVISIVFYRFVAVNMPVGMLLYWITSMTIGWGQARWLDHRMPILPPIQPCKRQVRYKAERRVGRL